jgi:phytoene dehydrogenase-like protein
MTHEVVVVGGGIGGLTVAALLAARGVDVCLLERQPEVGGCVASMEKFGYTFEPTLGLYSGWGKGETFERVFSELPVTPPEVRLVDPSFVAQLEDGTRIPNQDLASTTEILDLQQKEFYSIRGGAAALAEILASSIKKSGGSLRLSSPVLRLSYNSEGAATGVDLLTGENVQATKAIVSNMTVWDTYGKLIGLQRTPTELRKQLNALKSSGVYMILAGIDETTARSLPGHMLIKGEQLTDSESLIDTTAFAFAVAPDWDPRGPDGKRAATIAFNTDVDRWFTYHADHTELERLDQAALETAWELLHRCLPELGSAIEVIDTATPHTYYDSTRRKLGMVGTPARNPGATPDSMRGFVTHLPNVFMIGDTITTRPGTDALAGAAVTLVNDFLS